MNIFEMNIVFFYDFFNDFKEYFESKIDYLWYFIDAE